jgi:hypothetical protein
MTERFATFAEVLKIKKKLTALCSDGEHSHSMALRETYPI